jgi:hypothetical protein
VSIRQAAKQHASIDICVFIMRRELQGPDAHLLLLLFMPCKNILANT